MHLFKYRIDNQNLYITLPSYRIDYNESFISELMYMAKVINYKCYSDVHLQYGKTFNAPKLVKAALCGMLDILSNHVDARIWVPQNFNQKIRSHVNRKPGEEFTRKTLDDMICEDRLNYYLFTNKKLVSQAVKNISEIIARESIVSNVDDYEEFLTTVIGEIFVNSMMHSQQNEILLIFDVTLEENQFYLDVLILDYGKTIPENVQNYFKANGYETLNTCSSIEWAMQDGHTTRSGSGGYGLPMMRKYVKKMNGLLNIISGDVSYVLSKGQEFITNQEGFWPGTNVIFRIKLLDTEHVIKYEHNEEAHNISLIDI